MLKKLLKYDLLSLKRYLIPLFLLTPAVSLALGMLGYAASAVENQLIHIGLQTMYVFGMIALVLSLGLLPVLLVVRYYTGLFGDAGYLTLLIPAPRKIMLLSKVLNGLALMLIYLAAAFFSVAFAFGAPFAEALGRNPFYAFSVAFDFVRGLFAAIPGGFSALFAVEFVVYLIFLLTFVFNLFYTAVTLGAVVFQGKWKIGGAILFCVVSYMIWSMIKTILEAIPGAILMSVSPESLTSPVVFQVFLIAEAALYAGFSVGLFFFNARLIDRKLNLT